MSARPALSPAARAYCELLLGPGGRLEDLCAARPELGEELRGIALDWAELFRAAPRSRASRGMAEALLARYGGELSSAGGEGGAPRAPAPLIPTDPRYEVGEEIGRGGMGAVFAARDRNLGRRVAMKVLLGSAGREGEGEPAEVPAGRLRRFLEEARITGGLDHPGVVPIHELGIDERDRLYFTMRLVRGRDLGRVFRMAREGAEGWTRRRCVEVLLKVCDAVAFAHSRGILHRDLKPSNVIVGEYGEVYCLDWGLARVMGRDGEGARGPRGGGSESDPGDTSPVRTADGAVLGTPAYMSPEQALGLADRVGPRSDVYGLGAMLYELLTGRAPYLDAEGTRTPREVLGALLTADPITPREIRPDAPGELVAICLRAMARQPEERYPDVRALVSDLRASLEGRVVSAFESGAGAQLRKWILRHRASAAAALLGLLVVLGSAGLLVAYEARTTVRLERLGDALWPAHPLRLEHYEEWLGAAGELSGRLEDHRRALADSSARLSDEDRRRVDLVDARDWAGALDAQGDWRAVWRHLSERELVGRLRAFAGEGGLLEVVRGERDRVAGLRERTVELRAGEWRVAREGIRTSSRYGGLVLRPQLGLIPILPGPDPRSGLWEFALAASGTVPERGPDGELELDRDSALVLVLLPGGSFVQGALQPTERRPAGSAGVDPGAQVNEGPRGRVRLDPFFVSKYEMSRGQWDRLMGDLPAGFAKASRWPAADPGLLPVWITDYSAAQEVVWRYYLSLPTEAQWEYAARAGTSSVWSTGDDPETIRGAANLEGTAGADVHEDGPAPVGFHAPNGFGLNDVHGNLAEWCLERLGQGYLAPIEPGSGRRGMRGGSFVVRGGNFRLPADQARSACRLERRGALDLVGLRPTRAIDPEAWIRGGGSPATRTADGADALPR